MINGFLIQTGFQQQAQKADTDSDVVLANQLHEIFSEEAVKNFLLSGSTTEVDTEKFKNYIINNYIIGEEQKNTTAQWIKDQANKGINYQDFSEKYTELYTRILEPKLFKEAYAKTATALPERLNDINALVENYVSLAINLQYFDEDSPAIITEVDMEDIKKKASEVGATIKKVITDAATNTGDIEVTTSSGKVFKRDVTFGKN